MPNYGGESSGPSDLGGGNYTGGGNGGDNKKSLWDRIFSKTAVAGGVDTVTTLNPALALFNLIRWGTTGESIGDSVAEAALSGSPGTMPPGPQIGPPGGLTGGGSGTTKKIATILDTVQETPTPTAALPAVNKRKRIGRQETILTTGLSDTPVSKPTLLGQ